MDSQTFKLAKPKQAPSQFPSQKKVEHRKLHHSHPKTGKLYHAVAYYPELWPESDVSREISMMKECGINLVRIGEFAWGKMEPVKDKISLDFYIEVMDQLHANNIRVIFGTPTATPPIWLTHGHPERCMVNREGKVFGHGSRQHVNTDDDYVRKRCRIIVQAISKAIGNHPALVAWQIDNEFKCDVQENYSEASKIRWAEWLFRKYETIDQLNDSWGTDIWSQRYQSFDQIPMPEQSATLHHASLVTNFYTFSREMVVEFMLEQLNIIRKNSDLPITHNGGLQFQSDHYKVFKHLDFASFDHYMEAQNYDEMLMCYELWRNVIPHTPFWVMETCSSFSGCLIDHKKAHPDGLVRAKTVSAFFFGAQGVGYWVWRQQRSGVEMPHGSIISSWGEPALGYENIQMANQSIKEFEPYIIKSSLLQPQVAVTWSENARVFLRTEPIEAKVDYVSLLRSWTQNLRSEGTFLDLVREDCDNIGYRVIFSPFVPYLSDAFLNKIEDFVRNGGVWVAGPLTGGRTGEHTVHTNAGLGAIEDLAGVKTILSYPLSQSGSTGEAFGLRAPLGMLGYLFDPVNSIAVGRVRHGPSPNHAFITEKRLGQGKIVLIGAMPVGKEGNAMLRKLFCHYMQEASVTLKFDVTEGTVVAPRSFDGKDLWCIVNMDGLGGSVQLPAPGQDALTGLPTRMDRLMIDPYGCRLILFSDS